MGENEICVSSGCVWLIFQFHGFVDEWWFVVNISVMSFLIFQLSWDKNKVVYVNFIV